MGNGLGAKHSDTLVYYKSPIAGDKTAVIKPGIRTTLATSQDCLSVLAGLFSPILSMVVDLVYQSVYEWSH